MTINFAYFFQSHIKVDKGIRKAVLKAICQIRIFHVFALPEQIIFTVYELYLYFQTEKSLYIYTYIYIHIWIYTYI